MPDSLKPIIKIKKLNVVYFPGKSNEINALRDINIEIYPGELVVFFGPSGCGKSTLLYSIAGLEKNIDGDIYIGDKNLSEFSSKEIEAFHQKETGMIFQAFYLINSLTVLDNVLLPQIFLSKKKKERRKTALELLDYFGVKNQADKLPSKLSGGQQQRVAICRALMNDPNILLADEPVGNLDSSSANEVMSLLKDLNRNQKKTIILVTHNPAHLNFAHRVFYMKDGGVIETKINKQTDEILPSPESSIMVSRDLELLVRSYSSMSSEGIGSLLVPFKAKQIVSEALIGMTTEEVGEIEKKVERMILMGDRSNEDIFKFLDIDPEKGGMGMDKRTAEKLAEKITGIINEIKVLVEEEKKLKEGRIGDSSGEAIKVRQYLLDTFDLEIRDVNALKIFDRAVKDRINNKIDRMAFRKKIDLPLGKGGVGLNKKTAKKIAKRLELLILGKFK